MTGTPPLTADPADTADVTTPAVGAPTPRGRHEPRPTYPVGDYAYLKPGHGAQKLASSGVAPLIAAARGYTTVTPENLRVTAEKLGLGSMNTAASRALKKAVSDEDALIMPWTDMGTVHEHARRGGRPKPTTIQMRPSHPVYNSTGEPAKYLNLSGRGTVLDVHPATPESWFNAPTLLLTEGIIKGDSALTALLREYGIPDDVLSNAHDGDLIDGRIALARAMETIPVKDRVLIISFVGVANWRQNPEWNSFSMRDRDAWVAYDADTATNRLVWQQANDLFAYLEKSKKTRPPKLVRVPTVNDDPKAGMDDFFAATAEQGGGTWADLPSMLTDLPDEPDTANGGAPVGEWRVAPDGTSTQESVAVLDPTGRTIGTRWEDRVLIGGRIKSIEVRRAPTDAEIRTGKLGEGVGSSGTPETSPEATVEIEFMWKDTVDNQTVRSATVSGPADLLDAQPRDWYRHGATIPINLRRHPEWPPQQKSDKWVSAIKRNRESDIVHNVRWSTMGWVPNPHGTPVFIIGDQVIGADGLVSSTDIRGVTDHELPGAENFGVQFPADPEEELRELRSIQEHLRSVGAPKSHQERIAHSIDERTARQSVSWMDQAAEDLEEVVDDFLDSGAWRDQRIAATILAIGLRPCLPIQSSTCAYLVGKRRSGKSWSAGAIMSFWQHTLGTWSGDHLPGAAKDTVASAEFAVSRTPIWVMDDLAPSASRAQAAAEEAAVADLVRSIHNKSGKRRMNADMATARAVNKPRAVLVITAENELSVSSAMDRVVLLTFGEGSLHRDRRITDRVRQQAETRGATARLTGAFIRWFAWKAENSSDGDGQQGWPGVYEYAQSLMKVAHDDAASLIGGRSDSGTAERHARLAADLMGVILLLGEFAADVGASEETVNRLRDTRDVAALIAEQVASAHDAQSETRPGHALIEAVAAVLRSGRGHIASADAALSAPSSDPLRNRMMGWVPGSDDNDLRPQGPCIGWVTVAKDRETEVVLLDPKVAFNEAQRHFPDLIPFGSKGATSWSSVWDEGIALSPEQGGWTRRQNRRALLPSVQVMVDGTRVSGVPVAANRLLGAVFTVEPTLGVD